MGHLYLVRHAPLQGVSGLVYGTEADIDGQTPAAAFQALATALPEDATWVVSGIPRTAQTCYRVLHYYWDNNPIIYVRPFLQEQDFGRWVEQRHEKLLAQDASFARLRGKQPGWADIQPPAGESFNHMALRMAEGMGSLRDHLAKKNIVAFTSAGPVRAACMLAQGLTTDAAIALSVPHLSVTQLEPQEGDKWRVISGPQVYRLDSSGQLRVR